MNHVEIRNELRASRPIADEALRERVRAIAASHQDVKERVSLGARFAWRRRSLLVALPAAAVIAIVAGGTIGLTRSSGPTEVRDALRTEPSADQFKAAAPPSESDPANAITEGAAQSAAPASGERLQGVTGADAAAPTPTTGRAQRFSATLALEVKDTDALSAATQRAIEATRSFGGYLVSVSYGAQEEGAASLTLRVPTDRVQDAIAELSSLGTIKDQRVQIDDLQASLDETNRQVAVLRKRIAAITARLEDTSLQPDVRAQLQATRQNLRDDLAGSRRQATAISGEASLGTIQLQLRTKVKESKVAPVPTRIDRAVDDALEILTIEGMIALFALIIVVPIGIVLLGLWFTGRAVARRSNEKLLASS